MQEKQGLSLQMTVLIVDDNASVRRLLRRVLQPLATQIWERCDGAEALSAYREYMPDIVLMDIRMLQMDGLTATRQIRQAYPSARIVIVTDLDDDELRSAAAEAGACAYALKQDMTNLESLISQLAKHDICP
jgi:CheY-like chemotaxis protein